MNIPILLKLLCSLLLPLLLTAAAAVTTCPSAKCNHLSPEIRFPFRLSGHQPPECGLPHFNLLCKQNTTIIHLPSYGDLGVKSISYNSTRINLFDPQNCVHKVFLNLNLSLTPFTYYYNLQRYTYINCSAKLDDHKRVPCLSGLNYHVYIVRPSFSWPVSCAFVSTVEIPFAYSPYVSDSSFGLSLTWASTRLHQASVVGILKKYLRAVYALTGIIGCAFIAGKLLYASLSNYDKVVKKTLGDEETNHKLLQEYDVDQII